MRKAIKEAATEHSNSAAACASIDCAFYWPKLLDIIIKGINNDKDCEKIAEKLENKINSIYCKYLCTLDKGKKIEERISKAMDTYKAHYLAAVLLCIICAYLGYRIISFVI